MFVLLLCSVALLLSSALLVLCLPRCAVCALPWVCSAAFGTKPPRLIPLGDKGGSGNKGSPAQATGGPVEQEVAASNCLRVLLEH